MRGHKTTEKKDKKATDNKKSALKKDTNADELGSDEQDQEDDDEDLDKVWNKAVKVNWTTKKIYGLHDRFPPGEAWYDSNHTVGQLGYAKHTNI